MTKLATDTTAQELPTATPLQNDYAKLWSDLLAKQAQHLETVANTHRTERARFVFKMAKNGYSDAQIAKILGISGTDVGRLVAEGTGESVGIPVLVTQQAIKDGMSITKIKASRKAGKPAEIKAQLESIGLVAEPKESGTARETSTLKTRTDSAIKSLHKIGKDAKDGKTSLTAIQNTLLEIMNDLQEFELACKVADKVNSK